MIRQAASVALLFAAPILHAAGAQDTVTIVAGEVADSAGQPIVAAEVRALGTALSARSDERGRFRFAGAPPGVAMLEARRLGFRPDTMRLLLSGPDETTISFRLDRSPVTLGAVVVRGVRQKAHPTRLGGFYERLASGIGGIFITRAQLEQGNPRQVTDVLRRFPGVEIAGGSRVRLRGRTCPPLVWIDGVAMPAGEVELSTFAPSSLEGIEIYMTGSGAPGRYQAIGNEARCGTVLLWSRSADDERHFAFDPSSAERIERWHAAGDVSSAAEVDREARPSGSLSPAVDYPQALLAASAGGKVVAEFIVDASGKVEPGTFGIISSAHPLLSLAVYDAVRRSAFVPGTRAGRPIRQIVQMDFLFAPPPLD